jgi:hypothetical protein
MRTGRYFATTITHPALLFVAKDLDLERIRQFSPDQQCELPPMAEAVARARAAQIASYQRNGPHLRVVLMPKTSHYPFVDRTRDVPAGFSISCDPTSDCPRDSDPYRAATKRAPTRNGRAWVDTA